MKKWIHVAVVGVLLFAGASGLNPSSAEDGSTATEIGTYKRLTTNELTSDHVSWVGEHLEVEGPALTSEFTVRKDFLETQLGPWAADRTFVPGDGTAVVDGRRAVFMPLELGPESVFTWGHEGQVAFMERPMWVSVQQDTHGGPITLALDDGDSAGQQVFISRSWLWQYGITWFNVTHADGTVLPVIDVGSGVVVDVHHFSDVIVNPEGLDVKKRVGGVLSPNLGETRWLWNESKLEIDVDLSATGDYDILMDKDWIDQQIRPEKMLVLLTEDETGATVANDPTIVTIECPCPWEQVGGTDYYSWINSTDADHVMIKFVGLHIPVYALENDELVPHWGELRWNGFTFVLEVDVDDQNLDYEIMAEKDWVDMNIPWPSTAGHTMSTETLDGKQWYAVLLSPNDTPTTLLFREEPWSEFQFVLNITELRADLDAGGPISLPLAPDLNVTLNPEIQSLSNRSIVHDGQEIANLSDRLLVRNSSGSDDPEYRFTFWTGFVGEVCGLVEALGSSGMTRHSYRMTSYTDAPEAQGMVVLTRSTSNCVLNADTGTYPYTPPVPPTERSVVPQVYLEESWRNEFAQTLDAVFHASFAFESQETLWLKYTGNKVTQTQSWSAQDIAPAGDDDDYCSRKLDGFSDYLDEEELRDGQKPNVLISADSEMTDDCLGMAWSPGTSGFLANRVDNINYGLNDGSYNGKSDYEHLGKLIAQEIGHNWGERDHHCGVIDGESSVMCNEHSFDHRKFWFHYGATGWDCMQTTERVISATAEYDGEDGGCSD